MPRAFNKDMKTAIIAPIGTSPPVITVGIDALDEPVSDLVLLATQDEQVLAGCDVVKLGLKSRYPRIRVHVELLPFDDISSDVEISHSWQLQHV
jgi:CRISPR-associated protein Csx14